MFNVIIAFILLVLIIVSEEKEYRRKAAEKREREEEREIIRKIKSDQNKKGKDDLDAEFNRKYNIVIGGE